MPWTIEDELAEELTDGETTYLNLRPSQVDWPKPLSVQSQKPVYQKGRCIIRSCMQRVKHGVLCEECRVKLDSKQGLFS